MGAGEYRYRCIPFNSVTESDRCRWWWREQSEEACSEALKKAYSVPTVVEDEEGEEERLLPGGLSAAGRKKMKEYMEAHGTHLDGRVARWCHAVVV